MPKPCVDDFAAALETRDDRRARCTTGKLLAELGEPRASQLAAALANDVYTGSLIARVITGWGYRMAPQTLLRHRRGECACER